MKKLCVILAIVMAFSGLIAQNVKLGYVNTDRILFDSNEMAEISRLFQLDRQKWTGQIQALDNEIQQMERDFDVRKLTLSENSKRELQDQIISKKEEAGRLLQQYFGDNGLAEQRYRELVDPLSQKIHEIITDIAEDEKYTMILDVSMGVVLYAVPSIDITEQVLQELNKDTIRPTDFDHDFPSFPDSKDPFDSDPFGDDFKSDMDMKF
ncbi:MAG TPA: OmpH family outer membrane protein [Candidatus Cloacimonetes bacterium]|nr:OmpH family outer membrane protein [Candidatus Cloacimonadota bacterium]